jgi:hypothetical protein
VEERFLFDGVYMGGTGEFIDESVKNAFPVLPYTANSSFIDSDNTVVSAKKTMDFTIRTFLVKGGFFHGQPLKRQLPNYNFQTRAITKIQTPISKLNEISNACSFNFGHCNLVFGDSLHI